MFAILKEKLSKCWGKELLIQATLFKEKENLIEGSSVQLKLSNVFYKNNRFSHFFLRCWDGIHSVRVNVFLNTEYIQYALLSVLNEILHHLRWSTLSSPEDIYTSSERGLCACVIIHIQYICVFEPTQVKVLKIVSPLFHFFHAAGELHHTSGQ